LTFFWISTGLICIIIILWLASLAALVKSNLIFTPCIMIFIKQIAHLFICNILIKIYFRYFLLLFITFIRRESDFDRWLFMHLQFLILVLHLPVCLLGVMVHNSVRHLKMVLLNHLLWRIQLTLSIFFLHWLNVLQFQIRFHVEFCIDLGVELGLGHIIHWFGFEINVVCYEVWRWWWTHIFTGQISHLQQPILVLLNHVDWVVSNYLLFRNQIGFSSSQFGLGGLIDIVLLLNGHVIELSIALIGLWVIKILLLRLILLYINIVHIMPLLKCIPTVSLTEFPVVKIVSPVSCSFVWG